MNYIPTLLITLFFSLNLFSQNDKILAPMPLDLEQVEILDLESVNNEELLKAEMALRKPGRPTYFAHTFEVNVSVHNNGTWTTLPDGSMVWRMRILSEGAKSLNFGFSKYKMPAEGSLVIYSPDSKKVLGPFTSEDNEVHNQLWTPILGNDDLILEVWLRHPNKSKLELTLSSVNHDFIGINSASYMSGSCNLDVICSEADGWGIVDGYRDIIRSVAFMHLNGSANCTGFLVNNTTEDCTPLFMTAAHCGISPLSAPSLVTYWNFENSTCRQPDSSESGDEGDGVLDEFNTGSVFRASREQSDFAIVELDDPVNPAANAYRAGWNAEDTLATNVIGIHHPSNDEKRISFENDPVHIGDWASDAMMVPGGDHVIVPDWDIGTTEGGSSGSPLFDQNKRVIGQLHGGVAGCGNDQYDSYGWFHTSWDGGGAENNQLKFWLDPIDSGIKVIDGKECGFAIVAENALASICAPAEAVYQLVINENFIMNVALSISGLPTGLASTFSNNNPAPGETVTVTISNTASLPYGNYSFEVNGTDGIDSSVTILFIDLADDIAIDPTLMIPADMEVDLGSSPYLEWASSNANSYELEIATDSNFTNIVYSQNSIRSLNHKVLINLESETIHFWRLRGTNLCGTGAWSSTFSFITDNNVCFSESADNLPIPIIIASAGTITSTLTILQGGEILDINVVNLKGTHTWLGDLIFTLESPEGTSIVLISGACGNENDFSISFDEQVTGNFPCPYNDGGTYPPQGSLSVFNGENPQGVWTLTVEDILDDDGGSLDNWGLEFCLSPDNLIGINTFVSSIESCTDRTIEFNIHIGGGMIGPITLQHSPLSGVTVAFEPVNPQPGTTATATVTIDNSATVGNQSLELFASGANNDVSYSLPINILDIPPALGLRIPTDGMIEVPTSPVFSWMNPIGLDGLNLQISTDPTFSTDIILNTSLPSTSPSYIYTDVLTKETTYYWKVTSENSCGTTDSQTFSFTTEGVSAVDDLESQYFEMKPNPTDGILNIRLGQPIGQTLHGEIIHISGRLIANFEILAGNSIHELSLSNYPSGVYLVRLLNDQFSGMQKVVLTK